MSLFVLMSISQAGSEPALAADQTLRFFDAPRLDASNQAALGTDVAVDAYRVMVQADGIYQMTYADLQAAGLPVDTLDPRHFHLAWMGQEMAIQVIGEDDGRFDPQDAVLFYGQGIGSLYLDGRLPTQKYTDTNVYWLTVSGTRGKRMAVKDGAITGAVTGPFRHQIHLEEDKSYRPAWPHLAAGTTDHWYWDTYLVFKNKPIVTNSYYFTAVNIATERLTGELRTRLFGAVNRSEPSSYAPNHVRVYLNGHQFADPPVTAWEAITPTFDVPQDWFIEGSNVITVSLIHEDSPGSSVAMIWSDWLDVTYYDTYVAENDALAFTNDASGAWRYTIAGFSGSDVEAYDISDMTAVQRFVNASVTGAGLYTFSFGDTVCGARRYLVLRPNQRLRPDAIEQVTHLMSPYTPADLRRPASGADYIIISHMDFWAQAQRLAAHRAKSHQVALLDVQEIYDQFNGGLLSAERIREFLAYSYDHWPQPRPKYVLLLGDGTYDVRQRLSYSLPSYIPPYMAWSPIDDAEQASDSSFVTITGAGEHPDLYLGRLPANTLAEAQAMVDKIIAYETTPPADNFNQHVLFVADDPGAAGNFYALSDEMADGYDDPPTHTVKYLPEQYTPHKVYLGRTCALNNVAQCTAAITHTLNITGALVTHYVGMASHTYWAGEKLFSADTIHGLANGDRLPVMLATTASTAEFANWEPGIGEIALRDPGRGAVAYLGRSGQGYSAMDRIVDQEIFLALFHDQVELGPAIARGRWGAFLEFGHDVGQTWTLLGDPALKLKGVVNPRRVFLPLMLRQPASTPTSSPTPTSTAALSPTPTATPTASVTPTRWLIEVARGPDLRVPRMWHTATRLADGRVLLVGGSRGVDDFLADADIFDPATGQTIQVASLHRPRHDHSATLLPDGRVLVIGGYARPWQWLDDAEVYDPTADTWTVVPPRSSHGVTHTATVMQDGRVLVVGGNTGSGRFTEWVEIFNPQTNTWTEVQPLPGARASHTAQLLNDGRVLVTGGQTDAYGLVGGDGVLYDPQTNAWTATGPMIEPRILAQSVRLQDGRVLVAGGMTLEDIPENQLTSSVEIYDPVSDTWTAAASMQQEHYSHFLFPLPNGQVLALAGARDSDCCWTSSSFVHEIERYDPARNEWQTVAELPQPRAQAAAASLTDDRVWLTGGRWSYTTHGADSWFVGYGVSGAP